GTGGPHGVHAIPCELKLRKPPLPASTVGSYATQHAQRCGEPTPFSVSSLSQHATTSFDCATGSHWYLSGPGNAEASTESQLGFGAAGSSWHGGFFFPDLIASSFAAVSSSVGDVPSLFWLSAEEQPLSIATGKAIEKATFAAARRAKR